MRTCLIWSALALMITTARADQSVVLTVDSWWSGDYAKSACDQAKDFVNREKRLINQLGCDAVTACPDLMPRYTACALERNPAAAAHRFEDALMTQFSINPTCEGATFARYYGPHSKRSPAARAALDSRHWSLIIDYVVGRSVQPWTLQDVDHRIFHEGEGSTAAKIAADVCAILMGRGGTVVQ
jgi:hypothetical protein